MNKKLLSFLLIFGTLGQNQATAISWPTKPEPYLKTTVALAAFLVIYKLGTKLVCSIDKFADSLNKTSENLVGPNGLGPQLTNQIDKLTNQTSRLTTTVENTRIDVASLAQSTLSTVSRTANDIAGPNGHIKKITKTISDTSKNLNHRVSDLTGPVRNLATNGIHAEKRAGGSCFGFPIGSVTARPLTRTSKNSEPLNNQREIRKVEPTNRPQPSQDGIFDRALFFTAEHTIVPAFKFLFKKRTQ
jgi:hypothetical protein